MRYSLTCVAEAGTYARGGSAGLSDVTPGVCSTPDWGLGRFTQLWVGKLGRKFYTGEDLMRCAVGPGPPFLPGRITRVGFVGGRALGQVGPTGVGEAGRAEKPFSRHHRAKWLQSERHARRVAWLLAARMYSRAWLVRRSSSAGAGARRAICSPPDSQSRARNETSLDERLPSAFIARPPGSRRRICGFPRRRSPGPFPPPQTGR